MVRHHMYNVYEESKSNLCIIRQRKLLPRHFRYVSLCRFSFFGKSFACFASPKSTLRPDSAILQFFQKHIRAVWGHFSRIFLKKYNFRLGGENRFSKLSIMSATRGKVLQICLFLLLLHKCNRITQKSHFFSLTKLVIIGKISMEFQIGYKERDLCKKKGMLFVEIDTDALKRKIIQKNTTMEGLAYYLGIDRSTLYRKLRDGGCGITVHEARLMSSFLELSFEETLRIFWNTGCSSKKEKVG